MTVTSREIQENTHGSHVVTAAQLSHAEPWLRRLIGALLWLFSLAGNVLAFGGGWEAMGWDKALLVALGVSLGYQAVCTLVQAVTCRHWRDPLYLIALGASVLPSFAGYWALITVPLLKGIAGVTAAPLFSGTLLLELPLSGMMVCSGVLVGLIAVDVIPERVFIKH